MLLQTSYMISFFFALVASAPLLLGDLFGDLLGDLPPFCIVLTVSESAVFCNLLYFWPFLAAVGVGETLLRVLLREPEWKLLVVWFISRGVEN